MKYDISNKTIDGITDLVVWAPIKQGFIRAFENITYETRLKLVAEALHKVRVSAREHELITPFADTAERILTLLDFRIGIADRDLFSVRFEPEETLLGKGYRAEMEPRRYLYLAATFDGAWEPYMRLIWDPLGPFLDLLLCNCEGYVPAGDNGFPAYAAWVRANQLDSAIFYNTTGLTVKDQIYLAKLDRLQRTLEPHDVEMALAKMTGDDPSATAARFRESVMQPGNPAAFEVHRLALEALTVLYRLADYYPPDRMRPNNLPENHRDHEPGDGRFLHRAAKILLDGWDPKLLPPAVRNAYVEPLSWFELPPVPRIRESDPDTSHAAIADPAPEPKEVQAGLLSGFDREGQDISHGALLLMQVTDAKKLRKFLKKFPVSFEGEAPPDGIFRTLAFTHKGLERMRLPHDVLCAFPKEFREGMEARSGLLGDVRENHPRRWQLPERNWPPRGKDERQARPPVELSEVDFVIQLRASRPPAVVGAADAVLSDSPSTFADYRSEAAQRYMKKSGGTESFSSQEQSSFATTLMRDDPLSALIAEIGDDWKKIGAQLIAVESMHRPDRTVVAPTTSNVPAGTHVDHFGFQDGISQPRLAGASSALKRDTVKPGELLLGYANDRGDLAPKERDPWFANGTFLVIRKIAQNVDAFHRLLESGKNFGLDPEKTAGLLMGRYRDGRPLGPVDPAQPEDPSQNDFDFSKDADGVHCPFASHVRRTNPREPFQNRPTPRILRRGMSYGPLYDENPEADRGIMFMAYNASIAEQFETLQRWINGGNSSGVGSAQADPIVGIAPKQGEAIFRCIVNEPNEKGEGTSERVVRIKIPERLTSLRWGAYFFVPSRAALAKICDPALDVPDKNDTSAKRGEDVIAKIEALPSQARDFQWKSILEDFRTKDPSERSTGPEVWTAIREYRDGVYRLPLRAVNGSDLPPPHGGVLAIKNVDIFSDGRADDLPANQGIILVGSNDKIHQVLSDAARFSVVEQSRRVTRSVGPIYVAQDPGPTYYHESEASNAILFAYGEEQAYQLAYAIGSGFLERRSLAAEASAVQLGQPADSAYFKMELRREYLAPVLGILCAKWFDIPDALGTDGASQWIERGGWGWAAPGDGDNERKPRCPGDFFAPSRDAFYPRPTDTIRDYGEKHGAALRRAALKIVKAYRAAPSKVQGFISKPFYAAIEDDELLARNLVGAMIGMLAPMEGNLRSVIFDWLTDQTLWQHQAALHRLTKNQQPSTFAQASAALRAPVARAMCKRPAPDLLYRTATCDTELGGERIERGDLLILGLVSATAETGSIDTIFGGERIAAQQPEGQPVHACPAYKMAIGATLGIVAALLDVGRIQAQPASLIVKISGWSINQPQPLGAVLKPAASVVADNVQRIDSGDGAVHRH